MELRIMTALVVSKFDFRFPPGDDGGSVIEDMKDTFSLSPGKLELVFRPLRRNSF